VGCTRKSRNYPYVQGWKFLQVLGHFPEYDVIRGGGEGVALANPEIT